MKKTVSPHKIIHNGLSRYRVLVPKLLQASYNCTRQHFKSKADADEFAAKMNGARQSWSSRLLAIPESDQGRLIRALETVGGNFDSLQLAAEIYMRSTIGSRITLGAAIREFRDSKAKENITAKHAEQLSSQLALMAEGWEERPISEFTHREFTAFLTAPSKRTGEVRSFKTQSTVWGQVGAFWTWAVNVGYVTKRPMIGGRPEVAKKEAEIYSVDDLKALLKAAAETDPDMVAYFAITIFAGVRPTDEAIGLLPSMRLDAGRALDHFLMPAWLSKTGKARNIAITPTLSAWLTLYPMPAEGFKAIKWDKRRKTVARAAGVAWKQDALRHSYGSYSLSVDSDAVVTENMGNSTAILRTNYQGHVSREEAARYHSPEMLPASVLGIAQQQAA